MKHTTLEVGQIINTHGLRGDVKVAAWTDSPEVFEDIKYVYTDIKKVKTKLDISYVKYQKNNIILKFKGLDKIEDAEKLKTHVIYVDREQLGEPEEGYYICDLIGINVITDEGEKLGTISDVFSTGSNDVYVVTPTRPGKDILLPVIPDVVLNVDIDNEVATVHLMEGLLD